MTSPALIKQADVKRLIKGAEQAGKTVSELVLDEAGEIRIVFGDPKEKPETMDETIW